MIYFLLFFSFVYHHWRLNSRSEHACYQRSILHIHLTQPIAHTGVYRRSLPHAAYVRRFPVDGATVREGTIEEQFVDLAHRLKYNNREPCVKRIIIWLKDYNNDFF